jgi:hypothetical protein
MNWMQVPSLRGEPNLKLWNDLDRVVTTGR